VTSTWSRPIARTALIVGAGIGGLAAALALRRCGWDVRIFERASSPRELGFALALAPNAIAALRELGVAEPVIRDGFMTRSLEIRRGDGTPMKRIEFDVDEGALHSLVALRTVVHGSLLAAVGTDVLVLNSPAAGYDITADGVNLRLADGRRIEGHVLVGADGVRSVVRRHLHPGEPDPRASGFHAIRGVTDRAADQLADVSAVLYLGDGIEAGLARANSSAVYWYLSLLDADVLAATADPRSAMERAARSLDRRFASIALATRPEDLRLDRLFQRDPLDRWGDGPVTLLGDAAHPVLPYTAQGAALALEDAVALGLALTRGGDPVPALRLYERVRSKRTRSVVRLGPRIGAMTTTRNRARIFVRTLAIRMLPGRLVSAALSLHARDPHRELRIHRP
jgi:2-polyprenyl-6-methoxyphenol hydroxylase-like FAD-dependent oxidoreductase